MGTSARDAGGEGAERLLLVNPTSGRGRARRWAEWVRRELERRGRHARIVCSAGEAGPDGGRPREWWIFGGDGTLRRWLQDATAARATVALFPAGTGNVVARELAIPLALRGAFDVARAGAARPFDVGRVNGEPFAFMVSAGLDATVVHHVAARRSGPMRRTDWVFATLACRKADEPPFEVALDGAPAVQVRYAAVLNCGRYAGGFHVCPEARCDDGLFHVLTLRAPVAPRLLRVAWAFGRGTAARLPDAALATARSVEIRGAARCQVDGDPGPSGDLTVTLGPGALRMVAPAQRA